MIDARVVRREHSDQMLVGGEKRAALCAPRVPEERGYSARPQDADELGPGFARRKPVEGLSGDDCIDAGVFERRRLGPACHAVKSRLSSKALLGGRSHLVIRLDGKYVTAGSKE